MTASSKTQQHGKRKQACDRMKLHLRTIALRNLNYRLVTLRPHTEVAFSTNYYHDTWHILSDSHGARLLARLMWGLSYQPKHGTAVLIHGEHIKPTPFGAERSDPILLTLADGAATDQRSLRSLHRRLESLGPPQCTLRWHTFGLDLALKQGAQQAVDLTRECHENHWMFYDDSDPLWNAEQMFRRGGFVCYSAPPEIMRQRALVIAQMDARPYGMDYYYLADNNGSYGADGEVQIFHDYHERQSAAAEARREILCEGHVFADPDSLYAVVAARRDQLLRNRRYSRRKRAVKHGSVRK